MMISFFISLALAQSTAEKMPAKKIMAKSCPVQTVKWDKCEASAKKMQEGERLVLQSRSSEDEKACYAWTGKATVECKKGRIEVLKKQSSCVWDCICCY